MTVATNTSIASLMSLSIFGVSGSARRKNW